MNRANKLQGHASFCNRGFGEFDARLCRLGCSLGAFLIGTVPDEYGITHGAVSEGADVEAPEHGQ